MKFVVALLLAALQEAPLAQDQERIRTKPALGDEEKRAYAFPDTAPLQRKKTYLLAVVPVSFTDAAPGKTDLNALFFEKVSEFFEIASGGRFELRGKVLAPLALDVERARFKDEALASALPKEGFDGVAFVAAGGLGKRNTPLWPHKERLRGVDYILVPEEMPGRELGIVAHELMHLLGLTDKYADAKVAVGKACLLGRGYDEAAPAPPCADCREKLGWTRVAVIDPTRASSVVMEAEPGRSLKVPLTSDGSESLLFEMRDRLLIWHLGGGKEIELLGRYPTEVSDRLTPLSDPPFRGRSAGSRTVWVTDIRLEGGKAWFKVGPDAPLTPLEEWRRSHIGKRLGDR